MKKATLIIATLICLFVVVAEMPEASLVQIALVKGVALAVLAIVARQLDNICLKEESK